MTQHATIQIQLYDFVRDQLEPAEHAAVEEHLRTCTACRTDVQELRTLVEDAGTVPPDPAAGLPAAFWDTLLDDVDRRIASEVPTRPWYQRIATWLQPAPTPQYRIAITMAALLIVAGSALITWTVMRRAPEQKAPAIAESVPSRTTDTTVTAPVRLQKYFHRSRTLLVGVANMKVPQDQPADLKAERDISRELVQEARALRQEPLDANSARLITDLEKIQIELANMTPDDAAPGVDLIRHGIESKNLLFKIRMAETVYQQVKYGE